MQTTKVTPELQAISDRAYLYAYGIDEAYKHLHKTLVEPDCPANRFQIIRHLADDKYTGHVSINNDTLHLMGWLDVAAEPVIVSVPDHDDGRYWVLHTMDMGHYTTTMLGKRTRGPKGGRFMFANQTWQVSRKFFPPSPTPANHWAPANDSELLTAWCSTPPPILASGALRLKRHPTCR